jgi:hypothetical protein
MGIGQLNVLDGDVNRGSGGSASTPGSVIYGDRRGRHAQDIAGRDAATRPHIELSLSNVLLTFLNVIVLQQPAYT